MDKRIKKDQDCKYRLFDHPAFRDEDNIYYCRAMNDFTGREGYDLCASCPLFTQMRMDHDGTKYPVCRYYDIEDTYDPLHAPYEQKERIDGLISAGLSDEFPEYLPLGEESDKYGVAEEAIRFAARVHKGDRRKGSQLPYIIHPIEVMVLTSRMTDDAEVIAAAALHDTVEDTPCTIEDIGARFGERIADIVNEESENKREGQPKTDTWKVRKQENLEREKSAPREAKIVMLADKISNMRSTLRDYRETGEEIWLKFNMKDPAEQEWYYRSVGTVLSELSDLPEYKEYMSIVNEVFSKKRL